MPHCMKLYDRPISEHFASPQWNGNGWMGCVDGGGAATDAAFASLLLNSQIWIKKDTQHTHTHIRILNGKFLFLCCKLQAKSVCESANIHTTNFIIFSSFCLFLPHSESSSHVCVSVYALPLYLYFSHVAVLARFWVGEADFIIFLCWF